MVTSLAETHPLVAALWDAEHNDAPVSAVSPRSSIIGHWRCVDHPEHRWSAPVYKMTQRKRACERCASLAFHHPEIAAQWDQVANGIVTPWDVTRTSGKVFHWICPSDDRHRWTARVNSRTSNGAGCPQCSGRTVTPGVNDLATVNPGLAAEWDNEANGALTPGGVMAVSGVSAAWICSSNPAHRWRAQISNRKNGAGCPMCAGIAVSPDNCLAFKHPALVAQFVRSVFPVGLTANEVTACSTVRVLWRCESGHEYEAPVYARTSSRSGCPVCVNREVRPGINDLATTHPELAAQWVVAAARPQLTPSGVPRGADLVVTWQCPEVATHRWEASVTSRAVSGCGCPSCRPPQSAPERDLANVVKLLVGDEQVSTSVRGRIPGEIDILVEPLGVAIEFNGLYWHSERAGKGSDYHQTKTVAARESGLQLIHVWEDDWTDRRDVVVRSVAHRLNATQRIDEPGVLNERDPLLKERLNARSLVLAPVTSTRASAFLEANHIQGRARATHHLGLLDDNGLVRAVLSVMRGRSGEWTIERFATRGVVRGGFTRLLAFAERHIKDSGGGVARWVTFADEALSVAGLYVDSGFELDNALPPDYRYVVGRKRVHKFNYRIKRFAEDPSLDFVAGATERELAALNGLARIWDCGKTRWVKPVG